jgi:predicted metal-dependent phosphoesterase TrpH
MIYADLHAHTTASDGTSTPTELVEEAKRAGLTYLAVTDHDTMAGVPEALEAAKQAGIFLIPGVELSAEGPPGKAHLLGLGVDPLFEPMNETLAQISEFRRQRNEKIAARLRELGIPITLEAVTALAPAGANVGRPHFAQWLVEEGHVSSIQDAFNRYLADDGRAYIERETLTPKASIRLIHEAGGVCLLAHPMLVRLSQQEKIDQRIAALKEMGMDGIEVYYHSHTVAETERLLRLAQKYDLLISGGSDFHGTNKKDVFLGLVNQGQRLPADRISSRILETARK